MDGKKSKPIGVVAYWKYILLAVVSGIAVFGVLFTGGRGANLNAQRNTDSTAQHQNSNYTIHRLKGYTKIKPIISVEPEAPLPILLPLVNSLGALIDSLKADGNVTQASVYIKEFEHGSWVAVNGDDRYHPASLMKVALLLSYLKLVEADPSMLKRELLFDPPPNAQINDQYYKAPTIKRGKKYTVHELLYYMIAYSDNNATWVLASHFDNSYLKKLFNDFDLPEPVEDDLKFTLSPKEVAVFFKVIFSASYLSPEFSEYAADLLSNCSFKEGFVKGFPPNTQLWHKFGEWRQVGYDYELHESGVFYIGDQPYLLTIMTKGKDTDKLAESIRILSGKVYRSLAP